MKIAFINTHPDDNEQIKSHYQEHEISFADNLLSIDPETQIISLSHSNNFGLAEINKFSKLKLIQTRSTGFNHIDIATASEKNIKVANVPSYHPESIAEFTFTLILALMRNLIDANFVMKNNHKCSESLKGFSLAGKTLGIIGTGHIGKKVINIARGFEMDIIAFDPYPDLKLANLPNFAYTKELEHLAKNSDIVTIHAPSTAENHHLINKLFIDKMKVGSVLINTARGSLVDAKALYEALESGKISGAGLDVLEFEESLCNDMPGSTTESDTTDFNLKLINHPKVIATPHVAYFTLEAQKSILRLSFEGIDGFINDSPVYTIN